MNFKLSVALSLASLISFAAGFVITLNNKGSFQAGSTAPASDSIESFIDQPAPSGTLF